LKIFSKITNILLVVGILYLLVTKVPSFYAHFKSEGSKVSDFSVLMSNGEEFNSQALTAKKILVFWATWCPPCELELSRINELVKEKKIPADSVLAISINEAKQTVDRVVAERDYQFQVGYDFDGQVAQKFAVAGTPTVVFLNSDKTIRWITTGLSPLLKLRINIFLE